VVAPAANDIGFRLCSIRSPGLLGAMMLITLAALNYNPPDDTITNVTIFGFVLLGIATTVFVVVIVTGLASSGVRRLHDRGKTGYWLLLYYLPPSMMSKNAGVDTVGLVFWLLILGILIWAIVDPGVLRGDTGSNDFGFNPLAESPKRLAAPRVYFGC
jgi:uncharacterized membrane protein YhaH (DUF805 family)